MLLDAQAFKLSVDMDQGLATLKSFLKRRHWNNFEAGTIKLVYAPYFVFNYTIFNEETEERVVTGEQTGRSALNANDASFSELLGYILSEETFDLEKEPSHDYEFSVDPPNISKGEVVEVAKARLAAQTQVPLKNVLISGVQLMYLPTWRIWATVGGATHRLDVEAVLGTVVDEEKVPSRDKTAFEITMETLDDLKNPGNWPKYAMTSTEFLRQTTDKHDLSHLTGGAEDRTWLVPVLIVLILLLLAWYALQLFGVL